MTSWHAWKDRLLTNQWFFLLLVIIAVSVVTAVAKPMYLYTDNIVSILKHISVLGLVACGATILIISGNFDISVGAAMGLAGCVMAMLMKDGNDVPAYLAVPAGLGVAVLCGLFVGAVSIALGAPSFIVSLACIGIFKGIAQALTSSNLQVIFGKFETLGTKCFEHWFLGFHIVLPLIFLIGLIGYLAVHLMLTYSRLGRRVYSIGSNPRAAYLAGISVNRNKLVFFAISGLFVGVAAALLLSRFETIRSTAGDGYELRAIGAVVIGGAPMSGGKGKIIGTFLGVLLMGVISNALGMFRVNPDYHDIAFGVLIIAALAVSTLSRRRRGLSQPA